MIQFQWNTVLLTINVSCVWSPPGEIGFLANARQFLLLYFSRIFPEPLELLGKTKWFLMSVIKCPHNGFRSSLFYPFFRIELGKRMKGNKRIWQFCPCCFLCRVITHSCRIFRSVYFSCSLIYFMSCWQIIKMNIKSCSDYLHRTLPENLASII